MHIRASRRTKAAIAGAAVAAAFTLGGLGTATAADGSNPEPKAYDCNTWKSASGKTGYAYCSGLAAADDFRVRVTCIGPSGSQSIGYGPWQGNTGTSSYTCQGSSVGVYKVGVSFAQ